MREIINLNDNWKFCEADLPPKKPTDGWGGAKARAYSDGAAAVDFDDSDWKSVDLPHDFVSGKEYCFKPSDGSQMRDIPAMESIGSRLFAGGCLEGGIAWYRRKFTVDGDLNEKRVYIFFDGVYRDSAVYVNQYYVGTHASGYGGFYYDITDFLNAGENIIAVRVDASEREGWWYEGGGIYRPVRLETVDNVHIAPWGVSVIAAPDLANNTANIKINADILNKSFEEKSVRAEVEIKDGGGRIIARTGGNVSLNARNGARYSCEVPLDNVTLWDLENPYLYGAVIKLYSDDKLRDEYEVSFGIRDTRFDSESGFYLNGKSVRIRGLCCHYDHAGVGIAAPDSVIEYRVKLMKNMGANAVRMSHYPAPPELLNICDRLGMLVFEETRRMSAAPEDIEGLRAMVKRDRNHPSVFLWGIGNEEIFVQHRPETARATRTMIAEIKRLDPTRPVTAAVTCWDGERRYDNAEKYVDVTKNLDIMGFNYSPSAWDDYHKRVPDQPIIITEDSSNSGTRGCYSTDESKGQYCVLDADNEKKVKSGAKVVKKDVGEREWKYFAKRPYLAGIFLWTGFDYRGEPTPLGYPAVYSQFGIFDYCGFKKDNYYYYKSWWTDEPVLHVFPHWNHPTEIGAPVNVYCYSNLDEVEIFVNGKSYGKKAMERNWYLEWENVVYEPGELKAVGYKNGQTAAEDIVRTVLAPTALRLSAYKSEIAAGDTAIINAEIVDKNGDIVPTADNEILFEISGAGAILGTGNGNPGDHDSEKTNIRRAFNGRCQALVRAKGDIKITAVSEGLEAGEIYIRVN